MASSRATYRPYLHPNPPCSDCNAAPECATPLCSTSNALTAQCTDQCVVIACNDPDHAESMCVEGGPHTHCDLVCDETIDCTDCHGFDAFLQCCADYPAYNTGPSPPRPVPQYTATQSFMWDATFNEPWCDCGGPHGAKPSTTSDRPFESNAIHPLTETSAHGFFAKVPPPAHTPHQEAFQMNSFHHIAHPPPRSPPLFSCMWGSCHTSFSSLSELVGHVNLHHLVNSSSPNTENDINAFDRNFDLRKPQTPISCLWADCDRSSFSSDADRDLLIYHLMHEHLGITPPQHEQPQLDIASQNMAINISNTKAIDNAYAPDMNQPPMKASSSGSSSPNPTGDQHLCTGAHECRWKDCGLSFHSCDSLTTHITADHIGGGKAHYECFWDQCTRHGSQGFQSKQKICRHVQSHTGHRPFQCDICQQNFSEAATLQQHIRRHTQEKPYVCDYPGCGKCFAITGALTIHKRTHNGDKPFKCTFCDRGFAESSNLSKHLRTHTGARPYICTEPNCNKAFARPDQLNRHKGVHKKQLRGVGGNMLEE